jgi:BolA protein
MNPEQRVEKIRNLLEQAFAPESLQLEDESYKHVGHEGARDGHGHFRLLIVSDAFAGMNLLQRHRSVYKALGEMMKTDIHALNIEAFTTAEF